MDKTAIRKKITEITENGKYADSGIFDNFEDRQIYNVWKQKKAAHGGPLVV